MAYIGNKPGSKYATLTRQTFSTPTGTSHTLSNTVTNSDDLLLYINNVKQNPADYTASGTTLTTASLAGGTEMYCLYYGKTTETVAPPASSVGDSHMVDMAASKLTGALPALDGSALTGVGVAGISSSADATAMTITSAEKVGIGTATPDSLLHIHSGSAGTVTANGNGDDFVIENSTTCGMSFLSPNNTEQFILFGDQDNSEVGKIVYNHYYNTLRFEVAGSERVRMDANGLLFNGDTAAANALSDYEEGTFTPAWIPTSGGWSGTFNAAKYVKIGTMVWAGFTFTASSQATGTKMNGISGLPFTSASTGLRAVPSVALSKVGLTDHILHVRVQSNGSQADMGMERQGTGSGSEFLPSHTSASSQFSLTVCYQANA